MHQITELDISELLLEAGAVRASLSETAVLVNALVGNIMSLKDGLPSTPDTSGKISEEDNANLLAPQLTTDHETKDNPIIDLEANIAKASKILNTARDHISDLCVYNDTVFDVDSLIRTALKLLHN